MAGRISDLIIKKLIESQGGQGGPAAPDIRAAMADGGGPAMAQTGVSPADQAQIDGPAGEQVDPMVDFIAKKLAMLDGSPEQKYQILVQILPQIADAFLMRAQQAAAAGPGGSAPSAAPPQYDITSNMGGVSSAVNNMFL